MQTRRLKGQMKTQKQNKKEWKLIWQKNKKYYAEKELSKIETKRQKEIVKEKIIEIKNNEEDYKKKNYSIKWRLNRYARIWRNEKG